MAERAMPQLIADYFLYRRAGYSPAVAWRAALDDARLMQPSATR